MSIMAMFVSGFIVLVDMKIIDRIEVRWLYAWTLLAFLIIILVMVFIAIRMERQEAEKSE